MSVIKVISPKKRSLLKVDFAESGEKTFGVLYLDQNFEFCKVLAYRYGYPSEEVLSSIDDYREHNISFGSNVSDVCYKVAYTLEDTFIGKTVSVVVSLVHVYGVSGYIEAEDSSLDLYYDSSTVKTIEESVKYNLETLLSKLKSIGELYKEVNRQHGSI